jgi:hypothetical protein
MRCIRRRVLAVAATIGVFAAAAPLASASIFTSPTTWPVGLPGSYAAGGQTGSYGCGSNAPAGVGPAGGTVVQSCGTVLSFIGPSTGQIASVVGPTIIGSTVLAPVTVSAGPVAGR